MKEKRTLNKDFNLERKEKFWRKTIIKLTEKDIEKVLRMNEQQINDFGNKLVGN